MRTIQRAMVLLAVFACAGGGFFAYRVLAEKSSGSETAKSADAFVGSVGVNVHIHYTDTPYANFAAVEGALKGLGVRHIRDGMVDTKWQPYYDRLNELGRAGIKGDFITAPKLNAEVLQAFPNRVKDSFEAYEGPNEFDQGHGDAWTTTLADYMAMLYKTVKSNPATAGFPVIGPSLTKMESFDKVSACAPFFDYANLHNYFAGRNAGTPGWTSTGHGSIDWNFALLAKSWPGKPVMTTETGYRNDAENNQGIPEEIAGRYVPRLLLEQFSRGIVRTYLYELVDLGNPAKFKDYAFGMMHSDFSPKPAYTATKNLLGLLADPGPGFAPHALNYTLSGELNNVHHLLLEKRDGSFYLVIWVEETGYEVNKKQMIPISQRKVTIQTTDRSIAKIYNWDDQGEVQTLPQEKTKSTALTVSDRITVLEIR
jgi:hypothetical protein